MTVKWLNFFDKSLAFILIALGVVLQMSCGHKDSRSYDRDGEGWIGVYVQDLDRDMRRYLDLDEREGVLVNDVVPDSPAEDAGLRAEDIIVKVDGRRIRDSGDLTRSIQKKRPGERARIEVVRDDEKRPLTIRVGERPEKPFARSRRFDKNHPRVFAFRQSRPRLGIKTAELNQDLASYFRVDEDEGVLVLSVTEDSPAEKAGIKAGDIILKIEGERVRSTEALIDMLTEFDAGDEVKIELKRRGENRTFRVELDESNTRGFHFNHDFFKWDKDKWHEKMDDWERDMEGWERRLKDPA